MKDGTKEKLTKLLTQAKARETVKTLDFLLIQLNQDINSPSRFYGDCPYKELESLVNSIYKARMAASNILIRYGDDSMMDMMPKVKIE